MQCKCSYSTWHKSHDINFNLLYYFCTCTLHELINAIITIVVLPDPPVITNHPTGGNVPMGRNITLMCRASGLGTLVYSWERSSSGSSWTTVTNDNTTSYTTDTTLTIGQYMYRCVVSNEVGSVMSDSATVIVCTGMQSNIIIKIIISLICFQAYFPTSLLILLTQ